MKRFSAIRKNDLLLLISMGITNIGGWVYHIALNLILLDQTGSALAVTGLYLLKPFATLFTNPWAGSLIDRVNKRRLMILVNIAQALVMFILPLLSSLWMIYALVFLINMGSSIFDPTSMTYMTKLVPKERRIRFNSLRSLVDSGAFVIGPAIAGVLFIIGTPTNAIYLNAGALFLAGLLFLLLPDVETEIRLNQSGMISFQMMKEDWRIVYTFSRSAIFIILIYFLVSAVGIMSWGVDSLEASFATEVLHLTNTEYGFLVSIAGIGVLLGAILNTVIAEKGEPLSLIGGGAIVLSIGYLIFALSSSFQLAAIGCFVLSFSLSFMNTGFYTFYQNNIPVDVMGRIGSLFEWIEAIFVIAVMVGCGIAAELISIRFSVIVGSSVMLSFAFLLLGVVMVKRTSMRSEAEHRLAK
ncbi:MFS transporter [Bacillus hwajinpoensis]|uniref:MFS transporter n=1 Tax=Guptibacillus hwajinpoensis TaxID=208199 RepID=A0A845F1W6_9BACL|nr:MFS transporter [Pseudalkalibacillus hwajinpoensis]MYL65012.1 MFS transporter [Pseudalkalibacillus hwajinpoensis]